MSRQEWQAASLRKGGTTSSQLPGVSGVLTGLRPDGRPWVPQERPLQQERPPRPCFWWWARSPPPGLGAAAAGTGAQPSSRADTDTQIFLTATTQLGRVNLKLYPTARGWEHFHQNPVLVAPRQEGLVGQPRRVLSFLHRARVRTVGGRPCDQGDTHVPAQRAFPETSSVTPRMRPIRGL